MDSLLALVGPSGVGKSTIIRELLATNRFAHAGSITTRKERENEVPGSRILVTQQEFSELKATGDLYSVSEVYGDYYAYSSHGPTLSWQSIRYPSAR